MVVEAKNLISGQVNMMLFLADFVISHHDQVALPDYLALATLGKADGAGDELALEGSGEVRSDSEATA